MVDKCVYIAGPYMGEGWLVIEDHIVQARKAAAELSGLGVSFFCPHMHSAHFEAVAPTVPESYWKALDMHFLETSCNAILMLPGWQNSSGAKQEKEEAERRQYRVFYYEDEVRHHYLLLKRWFEGKPVSGEEVELMNSCVDGESEDHHNNHTCLECGQSLSAHRMMSHNPLVLVRSGDILEEKRLVVDLPPKPEFRVYA